MPLRTKLTEKLGISHPILLAPMGTASGGALAKGVTEAGGLGIIGIGYGNPERIDQEFLAAGTRGLRLYHVVPRPPSASSR
jgi:nitronate monooxygenase